MLLTNRPDMSWRLWSPEFNDRLAARLAERPFDVVEIEGIEMAPYLPTLEAALPRPLIVYDAHNAEWILQKRAFDADVKTRPAGWPPPIVGYSGTACASTKLTCCAGSIIPLPCQLPTR